MSDSVLETIGRRHSSADIVDALEKVRAVGGFAVNMDLIAGLPSDSADGFRETLDKVLALAPENITVHSLSLKRAAALFREGKEGAAGETERMIDYAHQKLAEHGYIPYYLYRQKFMAGGFENVGWCKPGTECFYNVSMMEELQTILSLGAGGVSKRVVRETGWIERANNPKYPLEYIQAADRLANGKKKLLFPKK